MPNFYHRTDNIDAVASSGRIMALKHLARAHPDIEIEVESGAGGSNLGGLRSSRERLIAKDAYAKMRGVKDVDNVFLTKDTLPPEGYGKYVIEKNLSSPRFNTALNLIANEYIIGQALSLRNNATVYAPEDELVDLRDKYSDVKFLSKDDLSASKPSLYDHATSLGRKLTKRASVASAAGLAGLGTGLLLNRDKLLGYHDVYHGTSRSAADSIREHGLDPSYGGTGAASTADRSDFVDNSRNKVHYTKMRGVAKGYADTVGDGGEVLRAYIPHSQWEASEVDPDARWGLNISKNVAATTTDTISAQNLKANAKDYLNKAHLQKYYESDSGRNRAAVGVIGSMGAGASLAMAARYLSKI